MSHSSLCSSPWRSPASHSRCSCSFCSAGCPHAPEFLSLLNNAGHAPIFGILAAITLHFLPRDRTRPPRFRHYATAFVIAVLAGVSVELIQAQIGRDAEAGDVLMDACGAAFVLCVMGMWRSRRSPSAHSGRSKWIRTASLLTGACVSATIVAAPLVDAAGAYAARHVMFPALARFDSRLGMYFVKADGAEMQWQELPSRWAVSPHEGALRVRLTREESPSIVWGEPSPDWRGYRALKIEVINPGDELLELMLRVHDKWHDQRPEDRFNGLYLIQEKTRGSIEIPLSEIANAPRGRKLDLENIAAIVMFEPTLHAQRGSIFYITDIRLE